MKPLYWNKHGVVKCAPCRDLDTTIKPGDYFGWQKIHDDFVKERNTKCYQCGYTDEEWREKIRRHDELMNRNKRVTPAPLPTRNDGLEQKNPY